MATFLLPAAVLPRVALVLALLHRSQGQCQPKAVKELWGDYPLRLDIGIYWYGHDDHNEKASGGPSKYYDPSKPTVIYFHGWAGGGDGWTVGCTRATSRCPGNLCPNSDLLADPWINDGWNFGMFYWDQFADEHCTRDAEQKVWLDRGNAGIRWKSFNMQTGEAKFYPLQDATKTVGDLCVESITLAMGDYSGPHVRFVGHSLGAQLATKCADMLHHTSHPAAPNRLALLEPFFTVIHLGIFHCKEPVFHQKVSDSLPQAAADVVKNLWENHRVPTEVYKSSALTENSLFGNRAVQLEALSALVTYTADWCGQLGGEIGEKIEFLGQFGNLGCKHCAVFPYYFLLYKEPPPTLVGSEPILLGCPVPSSACTDSDISQLVQRQHLMKGRQAWKQVAGVDTQTLKDDTFRLLGPEYMSTGVDVVITTTTLAPPTLAVIRPTSTVGPKVAETAPPSFFQDHFLMTMCVGLIVGVSCLYFRTRRKKQRKYESMGQALSSDDEETPGGPSEAQE